jgi:dihydrolipoamide dehydrogenase
VDLQVVLLIYSRKMELSMFRVSNIIIYLVFNSKGWGQIENGTNVQVSLTAGGNKKISAKNILIATGSEPTAFPGIQFDEKVFISSTGALSLESVPKTMTIIGAGVIGLELGSVYARFGTEVTVVEFADK